MRCQIRRKKYSIYLASRSLQLEALEQRHMLSANGPGATDNPPTEPECTLRAAIMESNANDNHDIVHFGAGNADTPSNQHSVNSEADTVDARPGDGICDTGSRVDPNNVDVRNILIRSDNGPLPEITDRITIDASPTSADIPEIVIDGSDIEGSGFVVRADQSKINGLIIEKFHNYAVELMADSNEVSGSYILSNETGGLLIAGSSNYIGLNGAQIEPNVISKNGGHGIDVIDGVDNYITGNVIGTDPEGASAWANESTGISVSQDAGPVFVGVSPPQADVCPADQLCANLISGNKGHGIMIETASASGSKIVHNSIGTDRPGGSAVANELSGVYLSNGVTLVEVASNIISGNKGHQVNVVGSGTEEIWIHTNKIGTNADGLQRLDEELRRGVSHGVNFEGGTKNNIVGVDQREHPVLGQGNTISGNRDDGIRIVGVSADNHTIAGNNIGLDANSAAKISNGGNGITLIGRAGEINIGVNDIGPTEPAQSLNGNSQRSEQNFISGNSNHGIEVGPDATQNRIAGNYIGVGVSGNDVLAMGNGHDGVRVAGDRNIIGGNNDSFPLDKGNIISANGHNGIHISGDQNIVHTNLIGSVGTWGAFMEQAQAEDSSFGNKMHGIVLQNATGNLIGSNVDSRLDEFEPNVIAFNGSELEKAGHGVIVKSGNENSIRHNSIHTNAGRGIDLSGDTEEDRSFNINTPAPENDEPHDSGKANDFRDFPVVWRLMDDNTIRWKLNSLANESFEIDFYSNDLFDPSGFGEGQKYLKSETVTTDDEGNAYFDVEFGVNETYISATTTDRWGNTSEFSMVDSDADALADAWEVHGIDRFENGVIYVLEGANPSRKDLFVEVDAKEGRAPMSFRPVIDSFDGAQITLHVEVDETLKELGGWHSRDNSWDEFDKVKDGIGANHEGRFGTVAERNNDDWNSGLRAAKELSYRYGLFVHTLARDIESTLQSGLAEGPGNDFIVSLGVWKDEGTENERQGTFMHELGHTLGLGHGGRDIHETRSDGMPDEVFDHANYKPNYPSAMNYLWQVPHDGDANGNPDYCQQINHFGDWFLDYSSGGHHHLDENGLDEAAGIGGEEGRTVGILGPNPNHCGAWQPSHVVAEHGPVDLNNDDRIDADTDPYDINGDGKTELLQDRNDWEALQFYFLEEESFVPTVHTYDEDDRDCPDHEIPEGGRSAGGVTSFFEYGKTEESTAEDMARATLVLVKDPVTTDIVTTDIVPGLQAYEMVEGEHARRVDPHLNDHQIWEDHNGWLSDLFLDSYSEQT